MHRRTALGLLSFACLSATSGPLVGCSSNKQFARVIKPGEKEMVGSHQAGQETFRPLIDEAIGKLLARHQGEFEVQATAATDGEPLPGPRHAVCFVGVTNKSAEEIGDFKEQLFHCIDARLQESPEFVSLNRQYVEAGLTELRMRPESLFLPDRRRQFIEVMERQGQPIEFLMFATITSGTTRENNEYQRDYQLVIDLVNVHTGQSDKQVAMISKAYHKSRVSRWADKHNPF
ncbi:MAG: penicillin-binding protein activator LpoB [Planctomycetota bacterium]